MAYKLIVTEHADELIDNLVGYLIKKLKNPDAALRLMDGLESIYERLEESPMQFPESSDYFLRNRGYREALVPKMRYRVIFRIESDTVYIVGVFHTLEDFAEKLRQNP
ncbi:MAG: type II toxin-antitoxin system RelE/ParE family toxin [Selenomonadaceae bacterium]|nr:type II toxin-antitoxin system RelE/ParE family toxin [Selenomonadaceae bacterium]